MRVAILTLAPATNYGGILQAWALRSLLADMGHEATVVSLRLRPAVALRYGVGNFLIRHHLHPTKRYYVPSHSEALRTTAELRRFIAEQVAPATPLSPKALQRAGYEAFVIGSDQVWNPDYTRPYGAENYSLATSSLRATAARVSSMPPRWVAISGVLPLPRARRLVRC